MRETPNLLARISVSRPVTVTVCLVALLAVGAIAYTRIGIQAFPSGRQPRSLWVFVNDPNASPQERDEQICRPLERHLRTVKNLRRIRTSSDARWGSSVRLTFRRGTDMSLAYNQVMDRLERAKLELPEEVRDQIRVWKYNPETDDAILWAGVSFPSREDLYHTMETQVVRPLARIDGVARVRAWGADPKEVFIVIDQERLQSRGVSAYALVRALQRDNFSLGGGIVEEGEKRLYVRSMARYRSLQEVENILIPGQHGRVRLRDVADVAYGFPGRSWEGRLNGRSAVTFGVFRESEANIVAVRDQVLSELRQIEAGTDLRFDVFFDQGKLIRDSIHSLKETGLWGGLFAALVLFFFLRAVRMTALITLAIPLCVVISVSALYFMGWTLNLITMMGLMVAIGMVVDNAIVIVENIYRLRATGEPSRQASVRGASEVGRAITMATLTTIVVFLPLIVMSGDVDLSFFLARIGMPVVIALLASLFVALIFIPLAAERFGDSGVRSAPKAVDWICARYAQGLRWTAGHKRDTLLIILALFATTVYPLQHVKKADESRGHLNDFEVRYNGPPFLSMKELGDLAVDIERFFEDRRDRYGIRTIQTSYSRPGNIDFRIFLDESPNRQWWYQAYAGLRRAVGYPVGNEMDRDAVLKDVEEDIPRYVGFYSSVHGKRSETPQTSVFLYGDDLDVLWEYGEDARRRLQAIPSVINVDDQRERADREVQVRIDREAVSKYGISSHQVGRSLFYQLGGINLPRYRSGAQEIEARLYLNEADRQTLAQLGSFTFLAKSGETVPLSAFATLRVDRSARGLSRENGKLRDRMRLFTTEEDLEGLYEEIDRAMEGFEMPRGYSWDKGERYSKFIESQNTLVFAAALAVTCVFLLMGVLFESVLLPFVVVLSIPSAFLGVYWTLYLTDTAMDIMAQIGLIMLIGVVVNNAIVLVDRVNRLRAGGLDRDRALLEAAENRFRPILMTSFTTIFGLLPMAVGGSTMIGIPYAPLGRAMMGGLFTSACFTLFVVPLFYTYVDDLRIALRRITSAVSSRPAA